MTIEEYITRRDSGSDLSLIQRLFFLSESTVWTLELGYQCYLKRLPLDDAINIIKTVEM